MSKEAPEVSATRQDADNRRDSRPSLRDIWTRFVSCLRPAPESGDGHGDPGLQRDVKKSVWSYRPYDVF